MSEPTRDPPETPQVPEAQADLAHTAHQPKNPLHGVTLEMMLRALVTQYGWEGLAKHIPARCFSSDPSMGSSLKFLRTTPWARGKVEGLYVYMRREQARGRPRGH